VKVSALVDRYLVEVPRACGMSVSSIRCALAVSQIGTETAFLKQIPYITDPEFMKLCFRSTYPPKTRHSGRIPSSRLDPPAFSSLLRRAFGRGAPIWKADFILE
jgi:hypothetical protein